ncbi:hypothetical protein L7F22_046728 [Adiantum nelumboides]|nr:hypothetical protein [Adiantum nelumboides]
MRRRGAVGEGAKRQQQRRSCNYCALKRSSALIYYIRKQGLQQCQVDEPESDTELVHIVELTLCSSGGEKGRAQAIVQVLVRHIRENREFDKLA